jgi:hypothetical protein
MAGYYCSSAILHRLRHRFQNTFISKYNNEEHPPLVLQVLKRDRFGFIYHDSEFSWSVSIAGIAFLRTVRNSYDTVHFSTKLDKIAWLRNWLFNSYATIRLDRYIHKYVKRIRGDVGRNAIRGKSFGKISATVWGTSYAIPESISVLAA